MKKDLLQPPTQTNTQEISRPSIKIEAKNIADLLAGLYRLGLPISAMAGLFLLLQPIAPAEAQGGRPKAVPPFTSLECSYYLPSGEEVPNPELILAGVDSVALTASARAELTPSSSGEVVMYTITCVINGDTAGALTTQQPLIRFDKITIAKDNVTRFEDYLKTEGLTFEANSSNPFFNCHAFTLELLGDYYGIDFGLNERYWLDEASEVDPTDPTSSETRSATASLLLEQSLMLFTHEVGTYTKEQMSVFPFWAHDIVLLYDAQGNISHSATILTNSPTTTNQQVDSTRNLTVETSSKIGQGPIAPATLAELLTVYPETVSFRVFEPFTPGQIRFEVEPEE